MAGKENTPFLRLGVSLLVLLGVSIALYLNLKGVQRLRGIGFFLVAALPFCTVYVLPRGVQSFRNFFFFSLAFPIATFPLFLLAASSINFPWSRMLGFWVLSASLVALVLGISRSFSGLVKKPGASISLVFLLLSLVIGGVWISSLLHWIELDRLFVRLNPLGALSDLFRFDWIRDGELYFRSQSEAPIRYPDWRWYAACAFVGGTFLNLFSGVYLSKSLKRG